MWAIIKFYNIHWKVLDMLSTHRFMRCILLRQIISTPMMFSSLSENGNRCGSRWVYTAFHTEVSPALLHLAAPWAPSAPIWIAHAHLLPADRDYVTIAIGWRNVYGRCPVSTSERRRGYCVCVCEGRARQSDYGLPSPSVVYIPTLSTSWLGLARMTSVFESYEQQFAAITADITVRIGRIPNLTGSKWPTSVTQALLVVSHFGEWRNGITGSLIYTWGTRVHT